MSDWKRNRLYFLRTGQRLSQQDVATEIGCSQAQYWKYESGITEPDTDTLKKLAKVFGVSRAALMEKAS